MSTNENACEQVQIEPARPVWWHVWPLGLNQFANGSKLTRGLGTDRLIYPKRRVGVFRNIACCRAGPSRRSRESPEAAVREWTPCLTAAPDAKAVAHPAKGRFELRIGFGRRDEDNVENLR